jgi:hypothetical protein
MPVTPCFLSPWTKYYFQLTVQSSNTNLTLLKREKFFANSLQLTFNSTAFQIYSYLTLQPFNASAVQHQIHPTLLVHGIVNGNEANTERLR